MKSWTLILCEGAHEQKAIASFAHVCVGWQKRKVRGPNELPAELRQTFPELRKMPSGGYELATPPDYLTKDDRYLVIRGLGSVDKVLGRPATLFLDQIKPDAVGCVVDANDLGVDLRVQKFKSVYSSLYEHATDVKPGRASGKDPRLGIWVSPNNKDHGRLDDLLLAAAERSKKKLVDKGRGFVSSLEKIAPDEWTKHREKAILGAINQVVSPGASLAVCLRKSKCWFEKGLEKSQPFDALLSFLNELTAPPTI